MACLQQHPIYKENKGSVTPTLLLNQIHNTQSITKKARDSAAAQPSTKKASSSSMTSTDLSSILVC
jgi:hypothetical protein